MVGPMAPRSRIAEALSTCIALLGLIELETTTEMRYDTCPSMEENLLASFQTVALISLVPTLCGRVFGTAPAKSEACCASEWWK